ncbi:MAG: hypothetical protein ACI9C2_002615, partial [Gammaproteobacteria bacterium]
GDVPGLRSRRIELAARPKNTPSISALTNRLAALADHPSSYNYALQLPSWKTIRDDQSGNGC